MSWQWEVRSQEAKTQINYGNEMNKLKSKCLEKLHRRNAWRKPDQRNTNPLAWVSLGALVSSKQIIYGIIEQIWKLSDASITELCQVSEVLEQCCDGPMCQLAIRDT